ncbi:germ cell nuclear acidic protein-like [Schistocerca nitens]|uniref:germ cell nuclear acidic protein-like n=1 Tax=Schistocerca nitens TaxID=7011 RepID=UPI0021173962|nr:germ cell nuclear acidic protein-like [Schistocerca nitens]
MDSSFVSFSPKRKLKKHVHSKITKLSLRHANRGQDKKANALRKNKSPQRCDRLQQTPPFTRISNLSTDDIHRKHFGKTYLDAEDDVSLKETKMEVAKTSLPNEEDHTLPFDPSRRVSASQCTCSVKVDNKTRISEDVESPKVKIEVRTPASVSRCNSTIVISETSSDESNSVAAGKPKKTSTQNVNIVISESDSESESSSESANSLKKSVLSRNATSTVLRANDSSDKQSEIEKWLQNVSPTCKNNFLGSREEHVILHRNEVNDPQKSWRSQTHNQSSSESEDNFEEFIKSIKKKNKLLQQKLDTPDSLRNFLTDGSAENSPAFYLSLTNKLQTEEKKKIVAERTKKIYAESEEIHPVVLKFAESEAEASDEETKGPGAEQKGNESTKVDSSPDVETVPSDTASEDTEDDSDIPSVIPSTNDRTEGPYQKQPQKVSSCRKPKNIQEKRETVSRSPVFSFLASLSHNVPEQQSHSDAIMYKREFKKRKEDLCSKLFCFYNSEVFKRQLPSDMSITWNSRLMKTAGLCYNKYSANKRTSRIELSVKVCDSADRLRDTLIHELCHSASWIIDGVKSGHGRHWKRWANTAMKCFPDIPPIRRCHDYKITTKFIYKCVQCGYSIGRHSKSLDLERKRCGYCLGKFELFINKPTSTRDTKTPAQLQTPRTPSAFAVFVKENYGSVKKERSDLKHGEVMKLLGQKFAAVKVSTCVNNV